MFKKKSGGLGVRHCIKLAHIKKHNSIVLEKKELWIKFFILFQPSCRYRTRFIYNFQTNNESYFICCYRRCYYGVCLTMSSQCLFFKINRFTLNSGNDCCNTEDIYKSLWLNQKLSFSVYLFEFKAEPHTKSLHFSVAAMLAPASAQVLPVPAHLRLNV